MDVFLLSAQKLLLSAEKLLLSAEKFLRKADFNILVFSAQDTAGSPKNWGGKRGLKSEISEKVLENESHLFTIFGGVIRGTPATASQKKLPA